ncbi:MAG: hypothetical protein HC846_05985 [Blastocatellia bacterium]|nr:hypothetical protein [Blastocatellia bacterium]
MWEMKLKKNLRDYRTGGIGALLDEYERAIFELKTIVQNAGEENYVKIADAETENEECRSIQTMMSHVVDAGYAYSNNIRKVISKNGESYQFTIIDYENFGREIDKMFDYQLETLKEK